MRVLNTKQMREADRRTIEEIGLPSMVLMENAGRQVVAAMESAFEDLPFKRIAVLCGHGNNGGDGFVVARTLLERSINVGVYLIGVAANVRGDARTNLDVLAALGVDVVEISDAAAWELHGTDVSGADIIVDAIFGTGFKGPLAGWLETVVADLNSASTPVVAIDLPSGLSADSQEVPGPAVHANLTVTLAAPKLPLVLPPAEALAGHLVIAEIGIPRDVVNELEGPWVELLTKESTRGLIEPRAADSHKGDYGRVLVVAGSRGKSGAAHLTATAALRSGAGLVTVGTPASCLPIIAAMGAETMTEPLPETTEGTISFEALEQVLEFGADVIAVGPGIGRAPSTTAFVHGLVEQSPVTLVLDADALNALAGEADRLVGRDGMDIIITPHPGEMARLTGLSIQDIQAHRLEVARDFASMHHIYVILKGHRTVVATPEGKAFINLTGNPGMATAGSGDVLTGMVAAWSAQLLDAEAACKVAVYLHGVAGDLAEADEGEVALIASDIISHLGDAVLEVTARKKKER
jgi:ADP-dependent NAD(P)H-hydrate dehydratase / NAD(P)H-hydrate epimerase